jgi:hypothetical protein
MPTITARFRTAGAPALLIALAGAPGALGFPPSRPVFPAVFELSSLDGTEGFVISGVDASDLSGVTVSSAGDVNADGFDDILIGAPSNILTPFGFTSPPGEAYIVFGAPDIGAGGQLELSALDGTNGFVIRGVESEDRCGGAVSTGMDVNGDGIDDILVGAVKAADGFGETYVVFGRAGIGASGEIALGDLSGGDGFVCRGAVFNASTGSVVALAGDLNNDGFADLVIGAPRARSQAGVTYVVFGGPGVGASGLVLLSDLDGTSGFAVLGANRDDSSGASVAPAGDLNSDGIDDLVIGAPGAEPNGVSNSGASFVIFGRDVASFGVFPATIDLSTLDGMHGFAIHGASYYSSGGSFSTGDVNADGVGDLLVSASGAVAGGGSGAGKVCVLFGAPGLGASGTVELSSLPGESGCVVEGISAFDHAGASVSSGGDVNGDGVDDILIGAPSGSNVSGGKFNRGRVGLVYGKPALGALGAIKMGLLDGTDGALFKGIDQWDFAGAEVSLTGDVNGDGIDDIIIGAPGADPGGRNSAGETYVVFGRDRRPQNLCPADVDGDAYANTADFVVMAGHFGAPVEPNTSGDLNGDGVVNAADFVILAANFGCAP